ncbi:MAG: hypothetical protein WA461_03785, partial [Nitrososphaeraceae archaeon]
MARSLDLRWTRTLILWSVTEFIIASCSRRHDIAQDTIKQRATSNGIIFETYNDYNYTVHPEGMHVNT